MVRAPATRLSATIGLWWLPIGVGSVGGVVVTAGHVLGLLVVCPVLLGFASTGRLPLKTIYLPCAALAIVAAASSGPIDTALAASSQMIWGLTVAACWVSEWSLATPRTRRQVAYATAAAVSAMTLFLLLDRLRLGASAVHTSTTFAWGRSNLLSAVLLTFAALAYALLRVSLKRPTALSRGLAMSGIAAGALTSSRGSILAAGAWALLLLAKPARRNQRSSIGRRLALAVTILPALPYSIGVAYGAAEQARADVSALDQNIATRVELWGLAMREGFSSPLWGTGPGALREAAQMHLGTPYTHAHNLWLSLWQSGGLLLLLSFIILVWRAHPIRSWRAGHPLAVPALVALTIAMYEPLFEGFQGAMLGGIALGLLVLDRGRRPTELRLQPKPRAGATARHLGAGSARPQQRQESRPPPQVATRTSKNGH